MNDEELWIVAMRDVQKEVYELTARRFRQLKMVEGAVYNGITGEMEKFAMEHLRRNMSMANGGSFKYIECIKDLRIEYGIKLKDAKDIVDAAKERLGANLYPKSYTP